VFAAAAIVIEAALGYLGLDVSPPAPSWGSMVADAATVISQQSWLIVPSGCIIGLTVLALGLVGDALRDAHAGRRLLATTARSRHVPAPAVASEDAVGASGDDLRIDVVENLLLRVRGLSVAVSTPSGELPVVDRVSFDLSRGESLGIVGESGSGKTLTALALLGLLPTAARVTGGSVRLGGRELVGQANSKEHARMRGSEIGFISQEPMVALDPVFTVGSVLREAVRVHHAGSRKDASNEVLELLGRVRLPSPRAVAARYPHELSGGMAQRVAIALALAGRPKLLIADEPTTALDVTVQAEILDLLRALRDDTGMSILLVTHDWGVIADFCERTAVMYAGQVVELADVADVFGRPQHPYTEGLLAANPHLAGHGPLRSIGGTVPLPGEWGVGCRFASRCPYVTEDCVESPVPVSLSGHGQLTRCLHPERVGGGSGVAVR
jgi:peptide/nickel transport system permease protein